MKLSTIPKLLLVIIMVSFSLSDTIAQESTQTRKNEFWNRFSFAGNFGFEFGTITGILLSPEIRFRVIDQFHIGTGFSYQYLRYKKYFFDLNSQKYLDFSANVYGGRFFTRYYLGSLFSNEIIGNLFAHAEYEYLTYTLPYKPSSPDGYIIDPYYHLFKPGKLTKEINSIFVGGGYKQPLGKKFFMDILVLFNINETLDSPYSNPVIRLGFGVGL